MDLPGRGHGWHSVAVRPDAKAHQSVGGAQGLRTRAVNETARGPWFVTLHLGKQDLVFDPGYVPLICHQEIELFSLGAM